MQSAEIIINSCYGGFSFSDKAIEEYKKQLQAMGSNILFDDNKKYRCDDDLRKDPVMIDIVRRLRKESHGRHAKLTIDRYNPELTKYIKIKDYDGREWIDADIELYRMDLIKNVLTDTTMTDSDKLAQIKEITERKIVLYRDSDMVEDEE